MTLSEEDLNKKQAAEYYKQKIHISESSDPYPDKKRIIADLYFLLAGVETSLINYPKAIEAYRVALTDYPPPRYPMEHTITQLRLAQTYERLATVETKILRSIEKVNAAGIEPTPVNPKDNERWLEMKENINPVDNLKQAIEAYEVATLIKNPRTDPLDYAEIQHNMGICYFRLLSTGRTSIKCNNIIDPWIY